jgi:hypothetical protein
MLWRWHQTETARIGTVDRLVLRAVLLERHAPIPEKAWAILSEAGNIGKA